MLHIPVHFFYLVKLPCSLRLVTTLTGVAPGGKSGMLCDKINGKLSCSLPYFLHLIISSCSCLLGLSGLRTFRKPQGSQEKLLSELLDAASQHKLVASLNPCWPGSKTANSNYCREPVSQHWTGDM